MTKVLITGGNGLVGSKIVEILDHKYSFINLSRSEGVDITNSSQVRDYIHKNNPDLILHLAAKADVDGCEDDKIADEEKLRNGESFEGVSSAFGINAMGTRNVAVSAKEMNLKIIYISTDFVFDGTKEEFYTEEDVPNPINWYAKTKYEGEKEIEKVAGDYLIARIAYPYRKDFPKKDFARSIISRFESGQTVNAVVDHIMTPTFIDDIANGLQILIDSKNQGIVHLVGSSSQSPYEISLKISEIFNFNKELITKTTREKFFENRAPRPFHLALKNDKIAKLGIKMRTIGEGLEALR